MFGITRMRRAPDSSPASSFASGTPAAMEMRQCLPVRWSRTSASTPPTWSGLTARTSTSANLATSGLDTVVFAPTSLPNAARAASLGSLAITSPAVTSPARIKPRARAVAILPAPRKPMVSFADMPRLYHVTCPSGSEKPGGQGCLEIRPVEGRTRNAALKPEGRNPKPERRPKSEIRILRHRGGSERDLRFLAVG